MTDTTSREAAQADRDDPGRPVAAPAPASASSRGRRAMAAILVLLVLLLCIVAYFLLKLVNPVGDVASSSQAAGIMWVRSIYGWGPKADQQLSRPGVVAIDRDGNILVPVMTGDTEIVRFGPEGNYQNMFHGSDDDRVLFPTAMTVGADGSVYVVQTTQNNVLKLSPDGRTTVAKMGVDTPGAIAMRGDRIVLGAEAGFAVFDAAGVPLKVVGSKGFADDQFDNVAGVAVDSIGNMYIVDMYNNRISKYGPQGDRLWIVKTGNPGNQQANEGGASLSVKTDAKAALQTPGSAVLDGRGRLVVLDMLDFSISVFDPKDGSLIAKYGTYGTAEGKFIYPSSIAYDPDRDWFAVADLGNDRVQIIRIPDSSDSPILSAARGGLSGPVRVLLVPLLLLLAALAYWAYRRYRQRAREKEEALTAPLAD